MKKIVGGAFLGFMLIACNNENTQKAYNAVDEHKAEQARLDSVTQLGHETFGDFRTAFTEQKAGTENFFVKQKFGTNTEQEEHLWISDIEARGDSLFGVVNSQPRATREVKLNDTILIDPARITDWMYYDNGKLMGGYSVKYERSKLSAEEKAEFDKQYNVSFD